VQRDAFSNPDENAGTPASWWVLPPLSLMVALNDSQLLAHFRGLHAAHLHSTFTRCGIAVRDRIPAIAWLCWLPNLIVLNAWSPACPLTSRWPLHCNESM
jgi:hypothetical protein